ncbi:MAG: hypothetical protein OEY49_16495 [Candidatus Heimdallarchaeota archaeon]|nr:hypothetical protein [Candidatus Heimdallarchaeota archaeon]
MKTLLILHYMCGSLATAGMVWAERVYVCTKKIIIINNLIIIKLSFYYSILKYQT